MLACSDVGIGLVEGADVARVVVMVDDVLVVPLSGQELQSREFATHLAKDIRTHNFAQHGRTNFRIGEFVNVCGNEFGMDY